MSELQNLRLDVNGVTRAESVDPSTSLADVLRQELRLTALHLVCEHGVCGACNVLVDGRAVRACLVLAADLTAGNPAPTEDEVKDALSGNLCRCTGYQPIIAAILAAAERLRGQLC